MTTTQDCGAGPAASPAISLTPTIPMSPTIPASRRAGLDHLDNLCKLMEQLGELRDQNSRVKILLIQIQLDLLICFFF